jgi:hypothetical protein
MGLMIGATSHVAGIGAGTVINLALSEVLGGCGEVELVAGAVWPS